ncbi:Putative nucleoside phosphorylase domain-containing protein [Septoria linicola]|uniref:Nucleoside phosphorylase domain-containing protein n=1 Tax=Septoria linicola TaxID=215465 RepID=A0A9Q9AUT2_9PEZI|nr:Putative nucleoside phosphorylase domain-containing protein [Septoria linicola]
MSTLASTTTVPNPRTKADYQVAWICALPVPELYASRLLFDETHPSLYLGNNAQHQYLYGSISGHNVVMGCLPDGQLGEASAAAVAAEMVSAFPSLKFALLVGVGGGVWSPHNDVRLGDVVVSRPDRDQRHGGVVQYDYGTARQGHRLQFTGTLQYPRSLLTSALNIRLSAQNEGYFPYFLDHLCRFTLPNGRVPFARPRVPDRLFASKCMHEEDEDDCDKCDSEGEIEREPRPSQMPTIHYGTIASANKVVRDAKLRDYLARKLGSRLMCFEMEAAGVLSQFNCLVIRGICDYCDSHKNKVWQPFAAAAAAAWAKQFLREIATDHVQRDPELILSR